MHIDSAIAMIQDHGMFAAATCDGVLAIATMDETAFHEDRIFEAPTVFEADERRCVDANAVRIWLGY